VELYTLTFIDEMTRKTWIYLLRWESRAFKAFKEIKDSNESESGLNIKRLGEAENFGGCDIEGLETIGIEGIIEIIQAQ
jgi:hypothetical protein